MKLVIRKIKRILVKLHLYPSESFLLEKKKKQDYEYLISHGVETEYGYVTLVGLPIISKEDGSRIVIGKGVTLVSDPTFNLAGINHPCILSTTRSGASIIIEDGCGLSGVTISCANHILLKKGVGLGVNVCIYDHDFHGIEPYNRCNQESVLSKPVSIKEFAWVGANSIILKGVHIGRAAVVGAGSVVTSDVPELCIYAGNPSSLVRQIKVDRNKYEAMFNQK